MNFHEVQCSLTSHHEAEKQVHASGAAPQQVLQGIPAGPQPVAPAAAGPVPELAAEHSASTSTRKPAIESTM